MLFASITAAAAAVDFTITGQLSFFAQYRLSGNQGAVPAGTGQIPVGESRFRLLYLCAYDENGGANDFAAFGDVRDDELLGCARADTGGAYRVDVSNFGTWLATRAYPDIYLVTYYCDGPDEGATSAAEVCVRLNDPVGNEDDPQNRKILWSRTYQDVPVADGDTVSVSWNVSCPNKSGLGGGFLVCAAGERDPAGAAGSANSNFGFNVEAAHAFRAAIEPVKTFGTMKPADESTFTRNCQDARCQDEIELYLWAAAGQACGAACSWCESYGGGNNVSGSFHEICLTTPMEAFRVVHEIGHNVHRRWMQDGKSLGGSGAGWSSGVSEKTATAEGWADFFSTASWYNEDAASPTYDGKEMESPDDPALDGCGDGVLSGEGRVAQFFWDLYDSNVHVAEGDGLNRTLVRMRNVWSLFPAGYDNRETAESDDDGRNVQDFVAWYLSEYPADGVPLRGLMDYNCVDLHDPD